MPLALTLMQPRFRVLTAKATEFLAALTIVAVLNFAAWASMKSFVALPSSAFHPDQEFTNHLYMVQLMLAGMACNLAAALLLLALRRRVLQPWLHIRSIIRHASLTLTEERDIEAISSLSVREMAGSIARFAAHAQNAYNKCRALQCELDESRQMMAQIVTQHQVAMVSANRELVAQYRSVLAYANYLDEHIRSHKSDTQLRDDFDDVCESGFNLKLIAQSLELLQLDTRTMVPVPLSALLQQTVIALAPSLERRVMRLSTAGVDEAVQAMTDVRLLSHALWMMLLGTIRYAAAESTLELRCFTSSAGSAIISIIINELEPGQLSPEERQAHMVRQLQHATPHMFAETIRLHANAQLAGLMLTRAGGSLSILPIHTHACEISLVLPAIKK